MSCLYEWVSEVTQSCPTLCDPMDCSLPGSSIHGIFQAKVLEWVAIAFSRGSSQPRTRTHISCIGRQILYRLSCEGSTLEFFFFILNYMNCLYVLEINSLSVANIFSHSEGWLFVFFMISFALQKLLSLISFHCLFLFLFSLLEEAGQKRSCCDLSQKVFCLYFPLRVL